MTGWQQSIDDKAVDYLLGTRQHALTASHRALSASHRPQLASHQAGNTMSPSPCRGTCASAALRQLRPARASSPCWQLLAGHHRRLGCQQGRLHHCCCCCAARPSLAAVALAALPSLTGVPMAATHRPPLRPLRQRAVLGIKAVSAGAAAVRSARLPGCLAVQMQGWGCAGCRGGCLGGGCLCCLQARDACTQNV